MNDERREAAMHNLTQMMSQALDNIEHVASNDPGQKMAGAAAAVLLGTHPLAGALIGPITGVLALAAQEVAKATGQTSADVVAGWRARVGQGLDDADRMVRDFYRGQQ